MDDALLAGHGFDFDPTHGYGLAHLLAVRGPETPADFERFWRAKYARALAVKPRMRLRDTGEDRDGWRVWELVHTSTGRTEIRGWMLTPMGGVVRRAVVIGHGYGGREEPEFHWEFPEAALVFPCARGLGRSKHPKISGDAAWHVLHNIQDRDKYVIGGCVEDLWVAVSAVERVFPQVAGHVGYVGGSFGGGLGAMACAWDERIVRAHLGVPTFGNQPLRATLGSVGSAASVQRFLKECPGAAATLAYHDAAVAARFVRQPVHCACARFDPAVAPAGQFSVYNELGGPKKLFVLAAGHFSYPGQREEDRRLLREIHEFFRDT